MDAFIKSLEKMDRDYLFNDFDGCDPFIYPTPEHTKIHHALLELGSLLDARLKAITSMDGKARSGTLKAEFKKLHRDIYMTPKAYEDTIPTLSIQTPQTMNTFIKSLEPKEPPPPQTHPDRLGYLGKNQAALRTLKIVLGARIKIITSLETEKKGSELLEAEFNNLHSKLRE
ncbi:MAG: hypothetical protein Q9205_005002 [Flavoplaca limonia]